MRAKDVWHVEITLVTCVRGSTRPNAPSALVMPACTRLYANTIPEFAFSFPSFVQNTNYESILRNKIWECL